MVGRALVVALMLTAGAVYLASASSLEAVPIREPLSALPMRFGDWRGEPAQKLDESILAVLGVDEYVHRVYVTPERALVGLYVAYYESQRQGDRIHSPAYCLPAGGWQPVESSRITIDVGNAAATGVRSVEVNRWVIQKGLDRQVALYWYHGRGRVVASEYWNKLYLLGDAMRRNRTDGALVRILSPVAYLDGASIEAADRLAVAFVREIFPMLGRVLPE